MTKIPPDDILEGLYKLRIRESDKLKTVLKAEVDHHRLKTMWDVRNKNFVARNGIFEIGDGSPKGNVLEETST